VLGHLDLDRGKVEDLPDPLFDDLCIAQITTTTSALVRRMEPHHVGVIDRLEPGTGITWLLTRPPP
jgi:hypothetical protein